jgi:hypothetical protein
MKQWTGEYENVSWDYCCERKLGCCYQRSASMVNQGHAFLMSADGFYLSFRKNKALLYTNKTINSVGERMKNQIRRMALYETC